MRQDTEHNPQKHLSNTHGGMRASAYQPPDPHWKAFPIYILHVGCVSLHPLGGAQNNFLSHAGSVYTICVIFFSPTSYSFWDLQVVLDN
jgi:hypothetical protein